ncbi:hypothetical protein [Gluconobacter kanchanaburiensis]|uniref:Uncharacterized protein n=1 Tax=Gluconobacter kanchanaburiensis NBRC 103587 TaxID=1307948 RepID=A0A511B582_9PROT|nr:hypothetical protein [Gluconobacter kanchanaburiensis]MBF0861878.1 hypothetical protein [Gluconobacter kanchanaburiensis]GBR67882.1 hypothetical protein AA103587_0517 [Gluconobacter kanchanaburiensis NBRC 103587]GEK95596.1 hypothetical protein GKA01_07930 [Gluconobacter kanchanaburiensis NBRC 103587]
MLKKFIFFCALLSSPALASDVIPQAYRASDNQYRSVTITSGLDASGKPVVGSYKDQQGQWHNTTVSVQACGVDSDNHPLVCADSTNASTLLNYVQKSSMNTANGVAALDANMDLTNPLTSGTDWLGAWQKNAPKVDMFAQGYESALFGGQTSTNEGNNTFQPRSVLIQSDPYGPYSAGCAMGVAMTGSIYNSQYPVSEQDPHNGASAVVGVGGFDTVANCVLVSNLPARLILTATGYTATSVQLASPLTAAQAAQIHPNMYITTNSPNPALSLTNTAGTLPKRNLYAGFVSTVPSAGDTSISVYAWDVAGYGTKASGQVPQTTTLDTVWSQYTSPTVLLGGGAASSAFGNNWFFNLQATDLTPSTSNRSFIHQITPLEVDLNIVNGTAPANSVDWQGISMNAGNQPAALTTDSRQIFLGGNVNHHLLFDGGEGNWLIDGDNIYVPSLKNQSLTAQNTAQIYQEWDQWIAGANRLRFLLWNSYGNPSATQGWQQAVSHFGPTVDGDPVSEGNPGGSKQGDIEWNVGASYGSISLCGFGSACGLSVLGSGALNVTGAASFTADMHLKGGKTFWIDPTTSSNGLYSGWCAPTSYLMATCSNTAATIFVKVSGDFESTGGTSSSTMTDGNISGFHADGHGNWNTTTDTATGGAMRQASYTLAALPTKNETDGNHLWCSDCKLNNISGVEVYWHASAAEWTDSQNNTLSN